MGDYIEIDDKPFKLNVLLPRPGEIILLRNGEVMTKIYGDRLTYEVGETGGYRVEARHNEKPWIFSIHIRIGNKGVI